MIDKIMTALGEGVWVRAGAKDSPEISHILDACAELCHKINSLPPSLSGERNSMFGSLFGAYGDKSVIHSPFRCDLGFNIFIGENFVGNFNLSILDEARVTIGDNVMIGPNCSLITIIHAPDAVQRTEGVMRARPITIGDDVWIAANVVVLPGVSIGSGSIIGAGSVVTGDIPAGVLAFGNPCRVIRAITDKDRVDVQSIAVVD